jgi:hypothetical protein
VHYEHGMRRSALVNLMLPQALLARKIAGALRFEKSPYPFTPAETLPARVAAKYYIAPRALLVELRHMALWGLRMRYYRGVPGGPGYLRIMPTSAEFLRQP